MVGISGGEVGRSEAASMAEELEHESWFETVQHTEADTSLCLTTHGPTEQFADELVVGDTVAGVVYGTPRYPDSRWHSMEAVLEAVLSNPVNTLAEIDGPFNLAVFEPGTARCVLATDKLASKPVYYTSTGPLRFSAELTALVQSLPEFDLNLDAIGDMLMRMEGFTWGEKTLAEGVRSLPPATVLQYDGADRKTTEYWGIDYGDGWLEGDVVPDLLDRYRHAVEGTVSDLSGRSGMELSAGLDSRLLAGVLARAGKDVETVTYDLQPGDGTNLVPAANIARNVGLENVQPALSPESFLDHVERGVRFTDGMVPWMYYHNLPFLMTEAPERYDAFVKGMGQGELFGDYLREDTMAHADETSATATLYDVFYGDGWHEQLLAADVDPRQSLAAEVKRSDAERPRNQVADVVRRNFWRNFHYRRQRIVANRVPTVDVLPDGPLIAGAELMPPRFRRHSHDVLKYTIPDPGPRMKFELAREFDSGIETVPYERTSVTPARPFWVHQLRFTARFALWKLVSSLRPENTYARWSRENDRFREFLEDLIESVSGRSFIDGAALRDVARAHFAGEDGYLKPIACLTTLEIWLQEYYD